MISFRVLMTAPAGDFDPAIGLPRHYRRGGTIFHFFQKVQQFPVILIPQSAYGGLSLPIRVYGIQSKGGLQLPPCRPP
jgi:hypothetical protein